MQMRRLGRTGRQVSAVGLGAWQLGADWGPVAADDARQVLAAAVETGITLIDTADVYGDGRSEQFVGEALAQPAGGDLFVATKLGRRVEQRPEHYRLDNFRSWLDRSRRNLGVDTIDLVQLHCPPPAVYADDRVFDALDTLVDEGIVRAYGVSVETCAEALAAIDRKGVATVQIILNCFRHRPLDEVLPAAQAAGVGILARVPLASGLLSGRYDLTTSFAADDHRSFNRRGEAFDVGETFAGVPYEVGLAAVRDLAGAVPESMTMAQFALRWILDQPGVSTVIPGARDADQVAGNAAVADLPPLTAGQHEAVRSVYDRHIRPHVHHRW
ncbi:aldo/keto reductase [Natronosporangium hydrolyticum]|uniref:Aldo/keto reductase n=1 Tax=Natronosporangium hydrolyticum TaxID=2811111 RepID=A0A895YM83_9ACTN|nr:aldo/keto reductase [Natronosporangium hydrolyticum]QSB16589.1 aldo/keto reductase [Natronosporangium hydrolyticum]